MSSRDRFTEKDTTFCPFYRKTGACRHGDRCSRQHVVSLEATTVLIPHFWTLQSTPQTQPTAETAQSKFEDFFAEIHAEMRKYGVIEEMHVLDNQSDHLIGNVYVRYQKRKMAESMVTANRGRWYAGRCMLPHLVPVPNFAEGRCRRYDMNTCDRGGACNFLHIKKLGDSFGRDMQYQQDLVFYKHVRRRRERDRRSRSDSRSVSRSHSRSRSRSRSYSSRSSSRSRSYSNSPSPSDTKSKPEQSK